MREQEDRGHEGEEPPKNDKPRHRAGACARGQERLSPLLLGDLRRDAGTTLEVEDSLDEGGDGVPVGVRGAGDRECGIRSLMEERRGLHCGTRSRLGMGRFLLGAVRPLQGAIRLFLGMIQYFQGAVHRFPGTGRWWMGTADLFQGTLLLFLGTCVRSKERMTRSTQLLGHEDHRKGCSYDSETPRFETIRASGINSQRTSKFRPELSATSTGNSPLKRAASRT